MWKLISMRLEVVLIMTQDRCTVRAKRTMALETILGARMELLGDVGQVEDRFSLFRDNVSVGAR
jgi:hypothetical protein